MGIACVHYGHSWQPYQQQMMVGLLSHTVNIIHDVNMNDQNSFISLIPAKHLLFTEETMQVYFMLITKGPQPHHEVGRGMPSLEDYMHLCVFMYSII